MGREREREETEREYGVGILSRTVIFSFDHHPKST
jgi:hypothetical protein